MYRFFIKKLLLFALFTTLLSADIDLQRGVYDAAEEMIRFDNKMNRLIAEHNKIDSEDMTNFNIDNIEDFEETQNGYLLLRDIPENNSTKVEVSLKDGLVTVFITKTEKRVLGVGNERSYETTMSRTASSLFLPQDADELSMKKIYKNGTLKVTFLKKI